MRKVCWILLVGALFLTACGGSVSAPVEIQPTTQEAVRTLLVEPTGTAAAPVAQAGTAAPEDCGTPSADGAGLCPPQVVTETSAPEAATAAPTSALAGDGPLVWSDQSPLPVLPAPPSEPLAEGAELVGGVQGVMETGLDLSGRLAVASAQGSQVIDLETGSGWQVRRPSAWLDWSPDGEYLFMELGSEGGSVFALYQSGGQPVQEVPFVDRPHWGAGSQILPPGVVQAADGREARLEYTPDTRWLLHVRSSPDAAWQIVDVESQPTDRLYSLISWVPGTDLILAQTYYAGNAAMTTGGQLVVIQSRTGQKQLLEPNAPLGESGSWDWNPNGQPQLAFVASGGGEGVRRLGVININTGQVSYPLPDGLMINDLAWTPDGARVAVSVSEVGLDIPPEEAAQFAGTGIYLVNPASGEAGRLTEPPQGEIDGFPRWTADGQTMLFARTFTSAVEGPTAGLYARRLSDGQVRELLTGVPLPENRFGPVLWQQVFAFTP